MDKNMIIKEAIVVEGRDDEAAVKKAVKAEVIVTSGFGITKETINKIKTAYKNRGIIVLTDPDFAGEKIRTRISKIASGCKHAFIPRQQAEENGDIGVENASSESIQIALKKARVELIDQRDEFTIDDLTKNDLIGFHNSSIRRDELGKILGIGYSNAKSFLNRLNNYGISRKEFEDALKEIE